MAMIQLVKKLSDLVNDLKSYFVQKSGDTMTGNLVLKNATIDRDGANPSSNVYERTLFFHDKDGERVGVVRSSLLTDGKMQLEFGVMRDNASGSEVANWFSLLIAKDGTCTYSVSNAANFRGAIGAVNKAGDTMTGQLTVQNSEITVKNTAVDNSKSNNNVSSNAYRYMRFLDTGGRYLAYLEQVANTDGSVNLNIAVRTIGTDNANKTNVLTIKVTKAGAYTYSVTSPANFRSAIGCGNWADNSTAVLYNNTTGTTGTVGLSATAANYNHMRIHYYAKTDGSGDYKKYHSVDVFTPNGKTVNLIAVGANNSSATATSFQTKICTISGTSITTSRALSGNMSTTTNSGVFNEVWIVRVEAWNE